MIDGYKYKDGKAIVVDYDKDNVKTIQERKYQDNIEELLMAENVREYLSNLKVDVENNVKQSKDEISEYTSNAVVMSLIVSAILLLLLLLLLNFTFVLGITSIVLVFFFGTIVNVNNIKNISKLTKKIKGDNLVLEGIEEQLEKNKINLRRLENDDKIEREDIKENNYIQLNYVEELK